MIGVSVVKDEDDRPDSVQVLEVVGGRRESVEEAEHEEGGGVKTNSTC